MKLKLPGILFFLFCFTAVGFAQSSTVAAGVTATGSGGTLSYSVGPIIFKKPNGETITDGIQQPYEILTLSTENLTDGLISLSFYPNPTDSFLHLVLKSKVSDDFEYQLIAIDGKQIVASQKITSEDTIVNLTANPSGIYILSVTSNQKKIKTFKIIKH